MKAYLGRFSTLASGSALGQISAAAASPILSRVFTPDDYGATGVVLSISMMLVFVATLRYEEVILTGKTATSRASAFLIAIWLTVLVSCLLFLGILAATLWSGDFFSRLNISPELLFFAPVILALTALQSRVLPVLLIQFNCYGLTAFGNFLNGAVGAAAQIAFGFLGVGPFGLLLGRVTGLALAVAAMTLAVRKSVLAPVLREVRPRRIGQVMKKYRAQAIWLAPAGFINTLTMQMPVFVLAIIFGTTASGAFFFTQTLANAALTVYRRSITALTAKEVQGLRTSNTPVLPFMMKVTAVVSVAGMSVAAFLFVYAENLIPILFGNQWTEAGTAAKWLGIFYAASAIHLPLSALSTMLKFQRNMLIVQVIQLAGMCAALTAGAYFNDFETTVGLVAIATALVYTFNIFSMVRFVRRDDIHRSRQKIPSTSDRAIPEATP